MGDLAAQLAAKFNTEVPLDADEHAAAEAEGAAATSTGGTEKSTKAQAKADPRAGADPLLAEFAALVEDVAGVEAGEVTRQSRLREDLGVDSLSLIELTVRAEETFGVRLEDTTVAAFGNVGEGLDYLAEHRSPAE
ncbi:MULTISPECIES: acyl carrier protein [Corynebacterium]|uniref:acyl carrier protein n=1 Tax=Corynebacterium TaxID=1716 RepID=UPI00254FF73C|nr:MULTISPECIES: acyl carrier protein [Corynebacterium]MDK6259242.1 acyl carrier protein [Corynebacterium frankenforstense]MDK8894464.1 acyl carrier protein [Corynebacterium sp. MSK006]